MTIFLLEKRGRTFYTFQSAKNKFPNGILYTRYYSNYLKKLAHSIIALFAFYKVKNEAQRD
jgi:hypothetical protein